MSIKFDFSGKKAIVTGASKGIGRDIVRALAVAKISKVYAVARSKDLLESLKKKHPCVTPVVLDLRDWEATRAAIDAIEPVDYLVNNAAWGKNNHFLDSIPADMDFINDLNVKSVINVSQIVCPKMVKKGGGSVVNMSSAGSKLVISQTFSYSVSKYTLDAVTKFMAVDFAPTVRVNSIHPVIIPTDLSSELFSEEELNGLRNLYPLKRHGTLEEVSNATMFLLSDGSSMCTGQNLNVDGGLLTSH